MKKVVASGVLIIVGVEVLALLLHDRRLVLWTSGAAAAIAMFYVRSFVGRDIEPPVAEPGSDLFGDSLRSWLSRTETMIRWSESTRSDWDRHLRPILARRFEIATGQRQAKDPPAFHATGQMLFGPELWGWVNPNNIARAGARQPGPGRATLEEILQRLEQI
ncbi:hypothetical protein [Mycobacterium xenopi]|uniref:Uncharacterized protein n=1 Tax=Mycobacterium xenopi TaxID=1789 RepID=A0AAD1H2Q1_MYCXE|nr:hypothetical protein [Mycobacterium xenopi]MDA3638479.1 hypothetical protein [Mycobacterium xenopi]MDA3656816.1 hypothetical protein [Mycobacterium xenopi]MDA3661474.1 hypothetical protein [Mycobacterium xenopi]ORX17570.1 hypothetical protein AWC32_11780 [Mycobacterium xenopi]SPX90646.1 Uncharacterised protein [Mycobacterium xenopi]